ncbi:MAG TPA: SUMF1/EgtB/PvdO family nonheme iron enzyme [Terriglobia bacterium]|nr:SUMF1/EgtB/PvdO family nonheme iron enzyme [Terriglobia bacterium]
MRNETRLHFQRMLTDARDETDRIFDLVHPAALYDRPIPERHRIIFYIGHLEAFDWNMVCRRALGMASFEPEFDRLFEFGIDPVSGNLPTDRPADWPGFTPIERYRARTRAAVDQAFAGAETAEAFSVAIEHRLMHAETLAYLLHRLTLDKKIHAGAREVRDWVWPAPQPRQIDIPAGDATLGRPREDEGFGWDNEYCAETAHVPAFSIDAFNVTNAQFLEFIEAGGYEERSFWTEGSWNWIRSSGIRHPNFWRRLQDMWMLDTMFSRIPLPLSWPVYVSHAEASAFSRWKGKALPTEAQYHRAAFGTPEGAERSLPWGDAIPAAGVHGNFDGLQWNPSSVGAFAAGASAFGVTDLMANGWEWLSTIFGPFQGFKPMALYPEYSAAFFDGAHFVMKGASPRTSAQMMRRSFRNWFQPHYPNIYATFRCVDN